MTSILFVCTGNICRSPSADALLRHKIKQMGLDLRSDSCGVQGYHVGEMPDGRSIEVAAQRGVDMSALRARKLSPQDFQAFDVLIAMDKGHQQSLMQQAPKEHQHKIRLFLDYVDGMQGLDVPDPYYGDMDGFIRCYDLIEEGVESLLDAVNS